MVEAPSIEITDPDDGGAALRSAVERIGSYDWLVLTSPNGVERTFAHVPDARALAGVQVAAVGAGTAAALARHRVVADLVPDAFVGEGLVAAFPAPPAGGGRVLVCRAAVARDIVPDGLRAAGWEVDVVDAYRSRPVPLTAAQADAVAAADAVTFASSSSVTNLCDAMGAERLPAALVSIGPVTSDTIRAHGLSVTAEADPHTIDGLVAAVLATLV
ncbi:uroporphyrinogen-III synthase [Aquihabitans daechungensis]|uniref:uroporphyrinogen-III synthase n=1 Tax=Aquihabitans daechungensis TaxID=1052257 RepID=UPI003BA12258